LGKEKIDELEPVEESGGLPEIEKKSKYRKQVRLATGEGRRKKA